MTKEIFDVAIVGAGPAGATCAWYLAKGDIRVALIDKAKFPRDKFCGDAVIPRAQRHLQRMGVLDQLVEAGQCLFTTSGGFVSPSGIECLSDSAENPSGTPMSVKRIILDERIVRAAQSAGAKLLEEMPVDKITFDERSRTWTTHAGHKKVEARTLVLADGAQSKLARSLGIVKDGPQAICSRAFIDGGSHQFETDGICYMEQELLPGYAAIFRHPNDELNFCTYIIPGGEAVPSDLKVLHHGLLERNSIIRRHLGSRYEIEPMKGAWLRLGGIPKSYADHLLIIGDAAGHIDPLTGEGIQFAMEGAEKAAETLVAAFASGRFDAQFLSAYQDAWQREFGDKFGLAEKASRLMARYPELVDSMAKVANDRGDEFFFAWADIMMGEAPWSDFLKPKLAVPMARAAVRELLTQRVSRMRGRLRPGPKRPYDSRV
ncbi:MAG: NAD(P)/FAD-dependent oxidoreductase [Polyangiales bacterium]